VDSRDLRDLVAFEAAGPTRADVLESPHLWSGLVCLDRNQQYGPLQDADSDALFLVVAGEVVVQVDRSRKRLKQWGVAISPAGREVTLSNASVDPSVVLVVAAPPPTPHAVTG
jgi:redox-sensitive bicupin YhaK (pirin superfamily)